MVLPGAVLVHRSSLRNQVVDYFEQLISREPSASVLCLLFNRLVYSLVEGRDHIAKVDRQAIEQLCELIEEQRPFPALLRARLIRRNLDSPHLLQTNLNHAYLEKTLLPGRLSVVAAYQGHQLGFIPGASVLIDGYSTNVVDFLYGLEPRTKRELTIYTVSNERWGNNEGTILKDRLEMDADLRGKIKILESPATISRLIKKGGFDCLVMCSKAVGQVNEKDVEIINSHTKAQLPDRALQNDIPIVVISGKYKIWPKDLFCEVHAKISDVQEYRAQPLDSITAASEVDWLVTEDGLFKPGQFAQTYQARLDAHIDDYPSWPVSESARPVVKEGDAITLNEHAMLVDQVYEAATDQGPIQFVKGVDGVLRMYEIYEIPDDVILTEKGAS